MHEKNILLLAILYLVTLFHFKSCAFATTVTVRPTATPTPTTTMPTTTTTVRGVTMASRVTSGPEKVNKHPLFGYIHTPSPQIHAARVIARSGASSPDVKRLLCFLLFAHVKLSFF